MAQYSACVLDWDTTVCFVLCQEIGESLEKKKKRVSNCRATINEISSPVCIGNSRGTNLAIEQIGSEALNPYPYYSCSWYLLSYLLLTTSTASKMEWDQSFEPGVLCQQAGSKLCAKHRPTQ